MTSLESVSVPYDDGSAGFVRRDEAPTLPPPGSSAGVIGWLRQSLFSSVANSILTIVALYLIWLAVSGFAQFALIDAVWSGDNREACLGADVGACWAFVRARLPQFIFGRYPIDERWRVDIVFAILAVCTLWMAIPGVPLKRIAAGFFLTVFPFIAVILLTGGEFDVGLSWWLALALVALAIETTIFLPVALGEPMDGERIRSGLVALIPIGFVAVVYLALGADWGLRYVPTDLWGGLLITLIAAITGIVGSMPIGVLLALGRRSELPIIRWFSVGFIEVWRGVPLITVLFFASVMLPLFMPSELNKLLAALIGIVLFSSAYIAEVVRGGLQAIPKGQFEGADAVGLGHWQKMRLIILPQALKHVIPGIMNSFIALFKDTSLLLIIGIYDLAGLVRTSMQDPNWASPVLHATGWTFAAIVFWVFCFSMSRYSLYIERRLETGHR